MLWLLEDRFRKSLCIGSVSVSYTKFLVLCSSSFSGCVQYQQKEDDCRLLLSIVCFFCKVFEITGNHLQTRVNPFGPDLMSGTGGHCNINIVFYDQQNHTLMKTLQKHCTTEKRQNTLVYFSEWKNWLHELTILYQSGESWLMYMARRVHSQHRLYCASSPMPFALCPVLAVVIIMM